jgi:hypothetical protein
MELRCKFFILTNFDEMLIGASSLFCGVNPHRGTHVLSLVPASALTDAHVDFFPLLQSMIAHNFVPANVSIGLVELGNEAFYSTENVTLSVSSFGVDIGSKNPPSGGHHSPSSSSGGPQSTPAPTQTSSAKILGLGWVCVMVAFLAFV